MQNKDTRLSNIGREPLEEMLNSDDHDDCVNTDELQITAAPGSLL